MIDRRYLRGAKDMREAVARFLEDVGLGASAQVVRAMEIEPIREAMSKDNKWTRQMLEEDAEHQRAGWRERTAAYQARKKSRGAVK